MVFIKRSYMAAKKHHILQDLTQIETLISMKASKTENRFSTDFQQPKTDLPKQRY